ncbi:dimethyl sulfoxide reductase anchor subunit family protein [Paraburkholderia hayleyella]|uniref:dimethyl sulfoxide reductase anchor subunit family protein n=1 Tax=Paraburkholderia hayleyella TaxID=2152889 RepID=UPI001290FAFE|nr:DmsC/YnfH family molybdoenzyme membrane anchor subunit [Paraburkholderia hayleyella]
MRPAFSVVFLTTLSGAAQGLLIALVLVEAFSLMTAFDVPTAFYLAGSASALTLGLLGLLASFFHLGHPERAWRAVAMWRTSWLSRECLALPLFLALTCAYGVAHWLNWHGTLLVGACGVLASLALFVCSAMIYACLRFLQEWASPLTLMNFVLQGCASGCTLAAACAALFAPSLTRGLALGACVLTLAACAGRIAALVRNARLRPKSTLQSATGIKSGKIVQTSRGFTAGSFNTREFFHGQTPQMLQVVKFGFLGAAFALPFALTGASAMAACSAMAPLLLCTACVIQYAGLVAERWFFFAEAQHPQNVYYQRVS